jgi:phage terminase large subunit GpA-like protein
MRRLSRLRPIIWAEIHRVAVQVHFIRRRQGWIQSTRNEAWDLAVYAKAAETDA